MFNAPQPRSRLYTKADIYLKCAAGAFLGVNYEGKGVAHLEQALVTMMPGQQVIAVPMCRVGIYLALKNIIRKGQKVILSPYTISGCRQHGAVRRRRAAVRRYRGRRQLQHRRRAGRRAGREPKTISAPCWSRTSTA